VDMQAFVLCRSGVIAQTVVVMIDGFVVVVVLVMVIVMTIMALIQCHGMNGVTGGVMMLVSMRRGSRDEAVACKRKRQAKAHEAPDERHGYRLGANCCILLNGGV